MSEAVKQTEHKPVVESDALSSRKPEIGIPQPGSGNPSYDRVMQLHQTIGNDAVQRMVQDGTLQAKLNIGQPNDIYEQEADRLADQVMRMTGSDDHKTIQKKNTIENVSNNFRDLKEELNSFFNVDEEKVLNLLRELTPKEKEAIAKSEVIMSLMADALNFDEMVEAVNILGLSGKKKMMQEESEMGKDKGPILTLEEKLKWMDETAISTSFIDYNEIKHLIVNASSKEKAELSGSHWKDFFIDVCDNETILSAIKALEFDKKDIVTAIEWMDAEGVESEVTFSIIMDTFMNKTPLEKSDILMNCPDYIRDDISYFFVTSLKDNELSELAKNNEGKQLLGLILTAMMGGWNTAEEDKQRIRLMSLFTPIKKIAVEVDDKTKGEATKLIYKHTMVYDASGDGGNEGTLIENDNFAKALINLHDLATTLVQLLPARSLFVMQVFIECEKDEGLKSNLDNLALNMIELMDDEKINRIAKNPGGKTVLLHMVRNLITGVTTREERQKITEIMNFITTTNHYENSKEKKTEVEVITYLYGGSLMNFGGLIAGLGRGEETQGHTALIVNGLVYSFEAGWMCGQTRNDYLATNLYRDGIGQVLDVSNKQANSLQENLNEACGTTYIYGLPEICTGRAAEELNESFNSNLDLIWDPQKFFMLIEKEFTVKKYNFYPKKRSKSKGEKEGGNNGQ